ncbi:MAG: adenylate/guanylate cyclase domain-containing protein [Rhodospirillaceae bacterium]|jgi:adenylate cyclase|nr:adenylate/guanylate cyclase domain-containing protein [Rhodospirillaceae bacterium]MBT5894875.1 adenylate/guanylate cyclase domain-containing protein [Rhodospirillaceae bacterium]MBT6431052.1 adenylate/guanylate cyclase domain-containing protein [Rhodospirillaceae bacterium]MBT7756807.1 adenylate/guanylate cyclase domain-containing protein [Rhodospirillaceae bacterium]
MRALRFIKRQMVYVIPAVMLLAAMGLRLEDPSFLQVFRLKLFDLYNQLHPREHQEVPVAILDLDDETLARTGQWPWPRSKLAEMLARVFNAGAKVVAFDVVFAEPDRTSPKQALSIWLNQPNLEFGDLSPQAQAFAKPILENIPDHDEAFATIIGQIRDAAKDLGVVAGVVLTSEPTERLPMVKAGFAVNGDDPLPFLNAYDGAVANLPAIEKAASGIGSFNLAAESDGIIRRVPTFMRVGQQLYPSLSLEALRVFQGASTYILKSSGANLEESFGEATGLNHIKVGRLEIPVDGQGRFWVHFANPAPGRVIPLWKVFEDDFDPASVAGKILYFGTSAAGLKDLRTTPLNPAAAGVDLHVQATEQILSGHFMERPDWADGMEKISILVMGFVLIVLTPRFGALPGASISIGTAIGAAFLSWYLYTEKLMLVDPIYPGIAILAIYLSSSTIMYLRTEAERERVRGAFSQYLSPALVEQLADEPDRLRLGGETRNMSFLFCDVRGFTTISESFKSNPQGLTRLINRFLTPLTNAILARNGTIDKYMGDCIMAFWNAPLEDTQHPEHACESALVMFEELVVLNEVLKAEAEETGDRYIPLKVGVGINTGDCVVGNMGSEQRFDYSVLGDAVNLAARLEGQSKNYGVGIVIGEETHEVVEDKFATIELDLIAVKGKAEAVRIHTILGREDMLRQQDFVALKAQHVEMLKAYRRQDWTEARKLVGGCRVADGSFSELYDMYDERIDFYLENPPDPEWDGVFIAETK